MKSVIIGAGKYGEVYLDFLRQAGIEIVGFLDDNPDVWNVKIHGVPVLGATSELSTLKDKFAVEAIYCPLGNNRLRVKFLTEARKLGYLTPNYIHPDVHISTNVIIDNEGVYILGHTYIMPEVRIEKDVMISVGANIIHHSTLHQGVFVSNGVNLGASLDVMDYAYIGMGSTIMTGVKSLGTDCLIGAGAVVIKDVPDGAVVAGVPAKVIKYKDGYNPLSNSELGGGKHLAFNNLAA